MTTFLSHSGRIKNRHETSTQLDRLSAAEYGYNAQKRTVISTTIERKDENTSFLQQQREIQTHKRFRGNPPGSAKYEEKTKSLYQKHEDKMILYRAILEAEKILAECKKCLGYNICDWNNGVRKALELSEQIRKNIDGRSFDKHLVEKMLKDHTERKVKRAHKKPCESINNDSFLEELCDLKQKLRDLEENRTTYEQENGPKFYSEAHFRLSQKISRAGIKHECYEVFNLLRLADEVLRSLIIMEHEFKLKISSTFLQPIDEYLKTPRAFDKNMSNYNSWQVIKDEYWKKPNIELPPFFPGELRKNCLISSIGYEIFEMEKEEEEERDAEYFIYDMPSTSTQSSARARR